MDIKVKQNIPISNWDTKYLFLFWIKKFSFVCSFVRLFVWSKKKKVKSGESFSSCIFAAMSNESEQITVNSFSTWCSKEANIYQKVGLNQLVESDINIRKSNVQQKKKKKKRRFVCCRPRATSWKTCWVYVYLPYNEYVFTDEYTGNRAIQ